MVTYSEDFKKSIIKKILLSDSSSINQISEDTGIAIVTLYRWLRKEREGTSMSGNRTNSTERTMVEKQELLFEAAAIPEAELGAWLRNKGIHEDTMKLWKNELRQALKDSRKLDKKENSELRKKNKVLEKEIQRKDKALAEMTTLMALKKKLEGIWFKPDEDL